MRKRRSEKVCNWRTIFSMAVRHLLFTLVFFSWFFPFFVIAEPEIKHLTVNDYLQHEKAKGKKANKLIHESSPYLLQHAYNPVDWHIWGDAAFAKAKKENKPIFLSIGYSTCHWCHVMAQESFENEKISALINEHFIPIKIDREQRPDIDSVYMSATQLINGQGGWPMTVFLDHDLRPFHAATYYPPFSFDGRLGLQDVLLKIHELWLERPEIIAEVATNITAQIIASADDTVDGGTLDEDIVRSAMRQISSVFDEELGGFSSAPKFPRPGIFSFLNHQSSDDKVAREMMKTTLDGMAAGGIYDQIAGGFHRYSVDANWQVPHFEKMLYSQALMVMAYDDYYRLAPDESYKKIIYETLNFVQEEMQSQQGGFYSALDADSERVDKPGEHAEGAYYLWKYSELKKLLSEAEFGFIKTYFHIRELGNIFSDPQEEFTELNILFIDEEYKNQKLTAQQEKWLASAKKKLNQRRLRRPRPHLDDKVITAWNGMMLAAFAKASVTFDDKSLLQESLKALEYIRKYLYNSESKKLERIHRPVNSSQPSNVEATLADYVWLIYGLLLTYDASGDAQWLRWAFELHQRQNDLFLDQASGAYFESVANDKSLLFRSKSIYDGVIPSANAIALSNLKRLSVLSDDKSDKQIYLLQSQQLVSSFATVVNQNPAAASMFLSVEIQ